MCQEIQDMASEAQSRQYREMIEKDNGILTFNPSDPRYESVQRWMTRNGIGFTPLGTHFLYNTQVKALAVTMPLPEAA
ncbi:hypothetical protein [Succinimonas sp.]|uniref:hypothetical protein n=1 Tax=Succinimonas sp. TaxID=1936151 RepID=UPI00386ECB59